jgi:hypothetical protein
VQQTADDMMKKPGGTHRICGTQGQAQHPNVLAGAGVSCSSGPVTTTERTALFDLICHGKNEFHAAIDFDTPVHVVVTLTEASPEQGQPAKITKHDLHWLSSDCGDLKPGEIREIVPPSFLKRP